MALVSAPWRDVRDLADMRTLLSSLWKQEGPHVPLTVCDLDWRPFQHPGIDLSKRVHLWRDAAGDLVAFAWFTPPDEIELSIDPQYREMSLFSQILAWGAERSKAIGSGNAPSIWGVESDIAIPYLLARLGFTATSHRYSHLFRSPLESERAGASASAAPEGTGLPPSSAAPSHRSMAFAPSERSDEAHYDIRATRTEELAARVEVHQSAFAPSRITIESYRRLTESGGYDRELDIVAVAPNGGLAAFAVGWLDRENHVGVIEPVGTHPDHRRRGLANRVTQEIIERLSLRGAESFLLYTRTGSAAHQVYEPLGFHAVTTSIRFDPPVA